MTMTNKRELGIYIHIPFCLRKCPYCGFHSKAVSENEISLFSDYKNRVIKEIDDFSKERRCDYYVDSIFFGGGTPTVMPVAMLEEILQKIQKEFKVTSDVEITVEANPGTIREGMKADILKALLDMGVNRISFGIQSFDDDVLKTIGRIHSASEAKESVLMAREAGFENINLDLMFGIPKQSMRSWSNTIERALELNPEHISFYSLQLEEGTPFFMQFEKGMLEECPDDLDREMYHHAIRRIAASGYKHYEISNASRPGFECRHNLKYWTGKEYAGFGDSAASYIRSGTSPESAWMRYTMMDGKRQETHLNSKFDDMSEFMFTGLRLTSGISYGSFVGRFGITPMEAFKDRWHELDEFFKAGLLKQYVDMEGTPVSLVITEKGLDVSNRIMAVFV